MLKVLTQTGDTIIEVLLSVVIISAVLGGAYVSAHTSYGNVYDANEHDLAVSISQSQIELLRTLSSTNLLSYFGGTSPSYVCFDPSNNPTNSLTICNNYDKAIYPQGFKVKISELHPSSIPPSYIFQVDVHWTKLSGGRDDVKMFYQTYGNS